ncbi:tautomerase family protein [Paraburkholderia hospita]|uniref:tautomerase family protein n=1 Tax=Paraburkholderia hospita TaxID=169430 RepID=UPI000DEF5D87|nr:tautomerase family protein [Paraburkholderia hospita]AXF02307.1 tautomerase family protein [Paraburkholderia hospita]
MPMTHVSMRSGKPAAYRATVLEGIHETLHASLGVHPETFFMTVSEHEDANFHVNTTFPFARSSDVLLVQITLTAGRSADDKQRFYQDLVARLAKNPGVDPADVFINLIEVAGENWSAGNGLAGRSAALAADGSTAAGTAA